jgi:hypothetical protein
MNKTLLTTLTVLVTALVLTLGASSAAYAVNGHGESYGPSFGGASGTTSTVTGTQTLFKDGLTINKNVFDVSKPGVTITTQTLYVGKPGTITLKIYDNAGSYFINGGAIFLNVQGKEPKIASSDTWIQFDKFGGVTVTDPHKILGIVTDKISYSGKFMNITFHITPKSTMKTSDLILEAWDNNLSRGTNAVINAVKIEVPQMHNVTL